MSIISLPKTLISPHTQISIWETLRDEALHLMQIEPSLSKMLSSYFADSKMPQTALAIRLADVISSRQLEKPFLVKLITDVHAANPQLVRVAEHDLKAIYHRDPACQTYLYAFMNLKGFHGLQLSRVSHHLWISGRREIAGILSNRVSAVIGIDIHPAAKIGSGIMLDHATGLVVGETAVVDDNVSILQNVTLGGTGKVDGDRHPKVRTGVMIGAGAKILGNIELGANSKIAAGSVVLKDVPANCTVAGIPAHIVRIHNVRDSPAATMSQSL